VPWEGERERMKGEVERGMNMVKILYIHIGK
jgi:hypothetical protein